MASVDEMALMAAFQMNLEAELTHASRRVSFRRRTPTSTPRNDDGFSIGPRRWRFARVTNG